MLRFWLLLSALALVVVAAVVAAQLYLSEPVRVEYLGWSAAPPMSVALGALSLLVLALLLAFRLLFFLVALPARLSRWGEDRKANRRRWLAQEALRLSALRDRRALLKTLAELSPTSPAAAWKAARTAEILDDRPARDKFLRQAAGGDDQTIAAAANAEICRHANRLTEADAVLKAAGAPRGPALLAEARYAVGKAREDWPAALAAAVMLRAGAPSLWQDAANDIVIRALRGAKTAAAAAAFWRDNVPPEDKKRPVLLAAWLSALARLGDETAMKEGLSQAQKRFPQNDAILELVAAVGDKSHCEAAFKANESRAADAAASAGLLRLLAELSDRLELPGKARRYRQMLAAVEPNPRRAAPAAAAAVPPAVADGE